MSFPDSVKSVFSQYATFSGRARRSEFWFWYLFLVIVGGVVGTVVGIVAASSYDATTETFGAGLYVVSSLVSLVWLALVLPTLAVMVRRLHDQDKSGFFWFLSLIPLVGGIIMIVLYALPGTAGPNRFGPDPKVAQAPAASYAVPA
ncbi:DUF805 domain-containing protein [Isoptericola hypogeus]|uniref:DUF805 domain-containing protein n=1 Tax=Isoptericola hypogeus TaxID=300179 RepID=A0ABN2JIJ2_9MICO